MVLVDTSVWIDHLRRRLPELEELLERDLVLVHPFVAGELACGALKDREIFLFHLNALPAASVATHAEAMELLQRRKLWGSGIGWVDAHLMTSALLTRCWFWTLDAKLCKVSAELGLQFRAA